VGKHCSGQIARSTHVRPESALHLIGPEAGVSVNTDVRPTKLNAVAVEFMPGSAHQQTNSSWCAEYIADMTGVSGGHSASQGAVGIGNGHGNGAPVGAGGAFNWFKTTNAQATISGTSNISVTQNESSKDKGFPCGMRPMGESADSLLNTEESDCCIYLNNNLQTLLSKRMSYLLGHAAATEKVAMAAQGYVTVNKADLFKWLHHDIKVQVTMADITHIAKHNLKARYKIVNRQICAVNGHSLSLPLMTFET